MQVEPGPILLPKARAPLRPQPCRHRRLLLRRSLGYVPTRGEVSWVAVCYGAETAADTSIQVARLDSRPLLRMLQSGLVVHRHDSLIPAACSYRLLDWYVQLVQE